MLDEPEEECDTVKPLRHAAKSEHPIEVATQRLASLLQLPAFRLDEEWEGDTGWAYGSSSNSALSVSVTRLLRAASPHSCAWMYGAPHRANYQVTPSGAIATKAGAAELALSTIQMVLGPLDAYPSQEDRG